ncbi:hypothetical protein KJ765_03795 [Candidatus Micrarchaeota archaeon]|nr:hypothetical protein [Candidatus Micrarchaeota archaeon]
MVTKFLLGRTGAAAIVGGVLLFLAGVLQKYPDESTVFFWAKLLVAAGISLQFAYVLMQLLRKPEKAYAPSPIKRLTSKRLVSRAPGRKP